MKLFFSQTQPSRNHGIVITKALYAINIYNCIVVVYTKTKIHGGKH